MAGPLKKELFLRLPLLILKILELKQQFTLFFILFLHLVPDVEEQKQTVE